MTKWDVVIIGAGPGGAFLAAGLAKDGLRVALVDKASFPRRKVCGGGISHKTLELLPSAVKDACVSRIGGAILTFRNAGHLEKNLDDASGGAVLREEMDHALLQHAIAQGASFFGTSDFRSAVRGPRGWLTSAGDHHFDSPILVGADGVFSQVRRQLFDPVCVRYTAALEAEVYCEPEIIEAFAGRVLFDFGGMTRGYGWIFPKADHLNAGVYSVYESRGIRGEFERFLDMYPLLRRSADIRRVGHAIPVENVLRQYERDGCLLVGDAGGFAEAFYGEGIYFALRSAECARRGIGSFFASGSTGEYSRLVRKELQAELTWSLRNARLFFRFQGLGFRALVGNARTCEWFGQLIHGGMSHREVFLKTLASSPLWAAGGRRTDSLPDASWLTA